MIAMSNIRNKKDRISVVLTRQRDRLQTLYDWNTVGLSGDEVGDLADLITRMNQVIARFKQ